MSTPPAGLHSLHFAQDSSAQAYRDVQLPRVFEPWARVLLEVVPPQPGDAVLDVATGPGTVARQAAALVGPSGRVTGVDISPAMLAVARAWPPEPGAAEIEYIESSATSMPVPEAAFDALYCQQGMQHMSDPGAALRQMRRALKPGGRLGLAAWTESPFAIFRRIVSQFALAVDQPTNFGRDAAELKLTLEEAGFQDVQVHTRRLTVMFEGGVAQALTIADSTSTGPAIAALPPAKQQEVRESISRALEALLRDGAVHLSSESNIASARG